MVFWGAFRTKGTPLPRGGSEDEKGHQIFGKKTNPLKTLSMIAKPLPELWPQACKYTNRKATCGQIMNVVVARHGSRALPACNAHSEQYHKLPEFLKLRWNQIAQYYSGNFKNPRDSWSRLKARFVSDFNARPYRRR